VKAAIAALAVAAVALAAGFAGGDQAVAGGHPPKAAKKRACAAGKKGARCRKRVRCARRPAARRPKSCPAKRRKRSASPAPRSGPKPERPGSVPPPGSAPPSLPAPGPGRSMSVTAREWSLSTSRAVLAAGSQTIELRNWGEDAHNLVISPDDGSHDPLVGWADQDPGTHLA